MNPSLNITFIGAGCMASALIRGLITRGGIEPKRITASDVSQERLALIARDFGIRTETDNVRAAAGADVIVLAVKPQVMDGVLCGLAGALDAGKLVISIAAGIPTQFISERLPQGPRIIRVMPNTPALIGEGAACLAAGPSASKDDMALALEVFRSVGTASEVGEHLMDAVTGLSGSGPAYVFLIIEALADAGVKAGLPRKTAQELAVQTLIGSARMVQETGLHPAQLKDQVTSPGGTTIAGMQALEAGGVRAALYDAVDKAAARSRELGRKK